MKTKAERLGITEFPYNECDTRGNITYTEFSDGHWYECKCDEDNRIIYYADNDGIWYRKKYENGKVIYFEDHNGNWWTLERFPNTICPYINF